MQIENLEALTRVMQASISPVALISGVGLIILSQTNRFSRVTERLRDLATERREAQGQRADLDHQISIFLRRSHFLRLAIGTSLFCVLLVSLMVLLLFAMAVLDLGVHRLVLLLFALSLLSLIVSLLAFIYD